MGWFFNQVIYFWACYLGFACMWLLTCSDCSGGCWKEFLFTPKLLSKQLGAKGHTNYLFFREAVDPLHSEFLVLATCCIAPFRGP